MAYLGLTDAGCAKRVRCDWDSTADHSSPSSASLKVDAFAAASVASRTALLVVLERFLHLHTLLATHAAMDHHDGVFTSKHRGDAGLKIIQGVAVLSEENKLLVHGACMSLNHSGTIWHNPFGYISGNGISGEDLTKKD
jgi:hypothetical protein